LPSKPLPIMDFKSFLCILVLSVSYSNGASLPADTKFDYHFNQLGVNFGVKFDDQSVPVKGGKIVAELPVHTVFKLMEGEPTLFKKMFVPFKEELYMFYTPSMLERLRDVMKVKVQITYKGEQVKSGIFDTMIDYTFIHPDYSEEVGTIQATGTGTSMSLEVVSKNDLVLPKFVFQPFKIEGSFKPNAEFKVVYTQTHSTLDMTLSKKGQTFNLHTIYKHPENEHSYDVEVDVAGKKVTLAHTMDGSELTKLQFLIEGNIFNLKTIQMKGKVQATRWFQAGPVESTFVVKGNDYEFNVVFNNKEFMKSKVNIQNNFLKAKMNFDYLEHYKGTVYMDFDTSRNLFEIKFPKEWFADEESFGITVNFKTLNAEHPFFGGVHTAMLVREDVPFFKVDLDYNVVMDATKYELSLNHFAVESLNTELVETFFHMLPITKYDFCHQYLVNGCFQKGDYQAKIFVDRVNKNYLLNKFKITGKVIKMGAEVLDLIVDTVSTPYHMDVFYPHYFQRMFNKPMERLTLDVHHTVTGAERVLKFITNYEDMVVEFQRNPTQISAKVLKKDVTYMEFTQEHKLNFNANKFFLTMKPTLHLHANSFLYKELCHFSTYTCFQELVGDVHVGVVAKGKRKINTKITVHKDTAEIYHLEVSNKDLPYKFVFKSPYVVPFFKYMRGSSWLTWMMPVVKSPFEVVAEVHPGEKTMMFNTNIDTHENVVKVVPLGGNKYNIVWNTETVAEFVADAKKVEVLKTLDDGTVLKTTITWTGADILENTVTATVMYKNVPQIATFGWNVRDSSPMTFNMDVVGKKAPMLGDFEFHRRFTFRDSGALELVWEGTASTNMMKSLATPIKTDAKITYENGAVQVHMEKMLNDKTFTFIFNTNPFKFAFLPFFEV